MNTVSVVTPTFRRPDQLEGLLRTLSSQTLQPTEVILVDGAPAEERGTEDLVAALRTQIPIPVVYIRHGGGTAIQRNKGIDAAQGSFIAFIDDDIRLDPDYFEKIVEAFARDTEKKVGGISGYIVNEFLDPRTSKRWKWYRRLRLFATYEPGRYDYLTGYPINRYLQHPHEGIRELDFMGTSCAVWRREVLDQGLRFDEFFRDYGVLEDAHMALRARRHWKLLECGSARCLHLRAGGGRTEPWKVAWKTAVNYRYVFMDIVPERTWSHELRFWRVQLVDLLRMIAAAGRSWSAADWKCVLGKLKGIGAAFLLPQPARTPS
ncbi:MAG: glycosyltransferase [Bryobacteraceae bacterium]|nr:glycosyltransferase [Bryobacteraceae bacterium]